MNNGNHGMAKLDGQLPAAVRRIGTGSKIFIVARHDFSIDGLASILSRHERHYLVSCVEPGDGCMEKFRAADPDILLIHNGVVEAPVEAFVRGIRDNCPQVRILVFGQGMDDEFLFAVVRGGAQGYINEKMTGEHILQAIETVRDGGTWIERRIMERFVRAHEELDAVVERRCHENIARLAATLTPREAEILRHVVQGLAIKEIAEAVHLSNQGVKAHLAKLFRKFDVANRSQLILAALDQVSPIDSLTAALQQGLQPDQQRSS